jgi:hypothetical protein
MLRYKNKTWRHVVHLSVYRWFCWCQIYRGCLNIKGFSSWYCWWTSTLSKMCVKCKIWLKIYKHFLGGRGINPNPPSGPRHFHLGYCFLIWASSLKISVAQLGTLLLIPFYSKFILKTQNCVHFAMLKMKRLNIYFLIVLWYISFPEGFLWLS